MQPGQDRRRLRCRRALPTHRPRAASPSRRLSSPIRRIRYKALFVLRYTMMSRPRADLPLVTSSHDGSSHASSSSPLRLLGRRSSSRSSGSSRPHRSSPSSSGSPSSTRNVGGISSMASRACSSSTTPSPTTRRSGCASSFARAARAWASRRLTRPSGRCFSARTSSTCV